MTDLLSFIINLFDLEQCYHCERYHEYIEKKLDKCRGCQTTFCKDSKCSEWICMSYPVCEACDKEAIHRGSKKRLRLFNKHLRWEIENFDNFDKQKRKMN